MNHFEAWFDKSRLFATSCMAVSWLISSEGVGGFAGKQVTTKRLLTIVAGLLKVADSIAFVFARLFPLTCRLVFIAVGVAVA